METKKIGAGILAIDKQTGDLLLGRRSMQSDNPGTWSPFGGTFEVKDISTKQTAKREFSEETGSNINYQISSSPFVVQDTPKVTFYTYIGLFDNKFQPSIDREHLSFGWFPIDSLPQNLHPGFADLISQKKTELENIIIKTKEENEAQKG